MNWEVFIPGHEPGALNKTVTVDAENWLEALTAGLDQLGQRGPVLSNLMLDIKDHAVHVTDLQRARVFEVRPLDGQGEATDDDVEDARPSTPAVVVDLSAEYEVADDAPTQPIPLAREAAEPRPAPRRSTPVPRRVTPVRPMRAVEAEPEAAAETPAPIAAQAAAAAAPEAPSCPPLPPDLPYHNVFFTHDEDRGEGNRLTYRERLIEVHPDTTREDAELLLRYLFDCIKAEIAAAPAGKFINLAVFDHEFRERAERPAVAALNWKDWRGAEPELTFPLMAPAVVETSYIPATEEPEEPSGKKRIPSQELNIGRAAELVDLNDVLAEVFEAMQDLYALGSLEKCIGFGMRLAAEKIPCEAAVGLAMTAARDAMVCVASRGDGMDSLGGTRIPLAGTLPGFAARQGVAVAVSDAANDPRVSAELDALLAGGTRSVLCAPLVFEGRTFGAVELLNRKNGDTWQQGEINIVSYVASQLAEYIAESLASEVDDFSDLEDLADKAAASGIPPQMAPRPAAPRPAAPRPQGGPQASRNRHKKGKKK